MTTDSRRTYCYLERKFDYGDSRMIAAERTYIRAIDELCAREAFRSCQSIPDFDGGDHEAAFEDGGDREASSEDLYFEDANSSEDGGDHTAI